MTIIEACEQKTCQYKFAIKIKGQRGEKSDANLSDHGWWIGLCKYFLKYTN